MKTVIPFVVAIFLCGCRTVSVSNVYVTGDATATITYSGSGTGTQEADKTLKDLLSGNKADVSTLP